MVMEAEALVANGRPIEITIVAWLVLVTAGVRAFALAALFMLPGVREFAGSAAELPGALVQVSPIVHQMMGLFAVVVLVVAGIGLLRAKGWSPVLLAVWMAWALTFTFLATGSVGYLVPKLAIFVLLLVVLFNPRARRHFRAQPAARAGRKGEAPSAE